MLPSESVGPFARQRTKAALSTALRPLGRGCTSWPGSAQEGVQNGRSRPSTHKGRRELRKPSEAVYAALGQPEARQQTAYEEQKGLHSAFP